MKLSLLILATAALVSCKTPEQNQRLGQLVSLAVTLAEQRGAITPADATAIRVAKTIIIPAETALPAITASGK